MATDAQIREHIAQFAPIIQRIAKEKGFRICSPIIAQSITESISSKDKSGWSFLKYKYHNMFGMKAGKAWLNAGKPAVNTKTGEYYNGNYVTVNDYFRAYPDYESGIYGYFDFIMKSTNFKSCKDALTPEQYLTILKAGSYATGPDYIPNNLQKINKYGLLVWDSFAPNIIQPTQVCPFTIGRTYTLLSDLYVRDKADGAYQHPDNMTESGRSQSVILEGNRAYLKKGTRVTCQAAESVNNSWWIKIPSGWVCGRTKQGKNYII